jgi:hypothetical protein
VPLHLEEIFRVIDDALGLGRDPLGVLLGDGDKALLDRVPVGPSVFGDFDLRRNVSVTQSRVFVTGMPSWT